MVLFLDDHDRSDDCVLDISLHNHLGPTVLVSDRSFVTVNNVCFTWRWWKTFMLSKMQTIRDYAGFKTYSHMSYNEISHRCNSRVYMGISSMKASLFGLRCVSDYRTEGLWCRRTAGFCVSRVCDTCRWRRKWSERIKPSVSCHAAHGGLLKEDRLIVQRWVRVRRLKACPKHVPRYTPAKNNPVTVMGRNTLEL